MFPLISKVYVCACVCVCVYASHPVVSYSLRTHGLQPTRLLCHRTLQARILQWVAIFFSRGSSQPRDRTWVFLHCRKILHCLSHQGSPLFQRYTDCRFKGSLKLKSSSMKNICFLFSILW